ncbi:CYTH domain-containing protein [Leucobacter chromiiresistens]|uniref:CYTH domain-containing protein n=1 Tax=Leucobacter chromiiresistens TaxID=1079994 RepID=UPI0007349206|nr:CYTH domain-containing protein [Leucobacter chromiiresistens]
MSENAGRQSLEIERKYEVAADLPLPPDSAFAETGLTAASPITYELSAVYFDTSDADLARRGLALRVRHGGSDAGWHLKERGASEVQELFWPLDDAMPDGVRAELRARIGGAADAVAPIAELSTERTVVVLADAAGAELVELADDRVEAFDRVTGVARAWREWEAELLPGAPRAALDLVEPVLRAAGAEPSLSVAKIARATGRLVDAARRSGAEPERIAALEALDASDRAAADAASAEGAAAESPAGSAAAERRTEGDAQ